MATPTEAVPSPGAGNGSPPLQPGRVRPAGAGWTWIVQGWRLFARSPVMWIISLVILFIIALVLGFIPVLGQLAFQILSPVFAAGFMLACRSLERGGDFELPELFGGFRERLAPLALVGVFFLLGEIVILLVFTVFAGFGIFTGALAGHAGTTLDALMASSTSILLGLLAAAALSVPLLAAYWFAPALVVLHDMAPVAAMRESFFACMRNFVPFLLYGVILLVFSILAAIPFGLGFLVLFPVMVASTYAAYRDIFTGGEVELTA